MFGDDCDRVIQPRVCWRRNVAIFGTMVNVTYVHKRDREGNCVQSVVLLVSGQAHQAACGLKHQRMSLEAALYHSDSG